MCVVTNSHFTSRVDTDCGFSYVCKEDMCIKLTDRCSASKICLNGQFCYKKLVTCGLVPMTYSVPMEGFATAISGSYFYMVEL